MRIFKTLLSAGVKLLSASLALSLIELELLPFVGFYLHVTFVLYLIVIVTIPLKPLVFKLQLGLRATLEHCRVSPSGNRFAFELKILSSVLNLQKNVVFSQA